MHGTCLAAGTVVGEGSFQGGESTKAEADVAEDLAEVGWSAEVDKGVCLRKWYMVESEERMWKPPLRMHLSLERPG